MAGCSVVLLSLATGALAVAILFGYFGLLGIYLFIGILFLILSLAILKMPELSANYKTLKRACTIVGTAMIVSSLAGIIFFVFAIIALFSSA